LNEVIVAADGGLGRITLNRPKALNALSLEMIRAIDAALTEFRIDDAVRAVLLDGAGERGFCAGGDIRAIYDSVRAGASIAEDFFRAEYRLNAAIAEYPKPIVALADGIVMGGGIGLAAHASHRVVSERSMLAMPEVGIGFFPDIGATWLLSRRGLGEFGTHIALAAPRLSADDALVASLADVVIASDHLRDVPEALRGCTSAVEIGQALSALANGVVPGSLRSARHWIDQCYVGDDVAAIIARLAARPECEARAAAEEIRGKSPISLKQTLRMLRHARSLPDLRACLEIEFRVAVQITSTPDFIEGVRAAIVDKDRNPRWSIAGLGAVTDELLERVFPEVPGWQTLFAKE